LLLKKTGTKVKYLRNQRGSGKEGKSKRGEKGLLERKKITAGKRRSPGSAESWVFKLVLGTSRRKRNGAGSGSGRWGGEEEP